MKTRTKQPTASKPKKAARLRVVKLEGRIAPRIALNHNETLAREPAKAKPQAPTVRTDAHKAKLQVVKLEERIAPRRPGGCDDWGCGMNHNETLVRDAARARP